MNTGKSALSSICVVAVMSVLLLAFAGCVGSSSMMSLDIDEETGAMNVAVNNAGLDNQVLSSIVLTEGDCLVISPVLDRGKLRVVLSDGEDDVFDQEISGKEMSAHAVDPGDYTLRVSGVDADPATGTMLIVAKNAVELREQDESLAASLEEAGIKTK